MARLIPNFKANTLIAFLLGCVITITFVKIPYLMRNPKAFGSRSNKKLAVIFGDSISQHGFDPKNSGWVACLSNYWTRKVDVINRGFSGYNSRWGMHVIIRIIVFDYM
jgi:lysophospholipase L1-like esterase